jgi:hypothetical protein
MSELFDPEGRLSRDQLRRLNEGAGKQAQRVLPSIAGYQDTAGVVSVAPEPRSFWAGITAALLLGHGGGGGRRLGGHGRAYQLPQNT